MTSKVKHKSFSNAAVASSISILKDILREPINVSIFQRNIEAASEEISLFLQQDFQLKMSGPPDELIKYLKTTFKNRGLPQGYVLEDIVNLLDSFQEITQANSFRILFSIIQTDMCRRFHTDFNRLRLLCTYAGPATYWLPEEGADSFAHYSGEGNEDIVKNPDLIQQANTGDVLILKGAVYPDAHAVIHRSPSIKNTGTKRLLLRVDLAQ